MNRRSFLKALGLVTIAASVPGALGGEKPLRYVIIHPEVLSHPTELGYIVRGMAVPEGRMVSLAEEGCYFAVAVASPRDPDLMRVVEDAIAKKIRNYFWFKRKLRIDVVPNDRRIA